MEAYATVEYADQYLGDLLTADKWASTESDTKERALSEATVRIDMLAYRGKKAQPSQVRAFPRYPDTTVPEAVKQACCLEALFLVDSQANPAYARRLADIRQGVKSVSIGDASESYADIAEIKKTQGGLGSDMALALLRLYLAARGVYPIV